MSSASAGAQASDQALAAQANQNSAFAKQARDKLFGENLSGGGTLSSFLDPNSLNVDKPTGTYGLQYNKAIENIANQSAQTRGSLSRYNASRGFGNAPSGFAEDQQRRAASDQVNQQGAAFTDFAGKSYQDALGKFWQATGALQGEGTTALSSSIAADSSAANNYANLYGTASQPRPNPLAAIVGGGLQAGGTVGSAALTGKGSKGGLPSGDPSICWIAEVIYGHDDYRTQVVRQWLKGDFRRTRLGSIIIPLYQRYGKRVAAVVKRSIILKAFFRPLFDRVFSNAIEAMQRPPASLITRPKNPDPTFEGIEYQR